MSRRYRVAAPTSAVGRALALAACVVFAPTLARASFSTTDYTLPVQQGPVSLNAGDCTGDGLPDVIVSNQDSNNVTILRNRGNGTFAFWRTISLGAGPDVPVAPRVYSAVCGDFTNDGLIDVAILSKGLGTLTIKRREASGSYTSLPPIELGGLPGSVTAADLNHDGNLDLVVAASNSSDIVVLLGDGNGGFPTISTIHIPTVRLTNRLVGAVVADFDLDGHLDILVASQGTPLGCTGCDPEPSLRLFTGDSFGTYTQSTTALPTPFRPQWVATTDLDGDNIPDLAILSRDRILSFYLGSAAGGFVPFKTLTVPPGTSGFALADFNGDGLIDLAVSFYKTNDVQVLLATGVAEFQLPGRFTGQSTIANPIFNSPDAPPTTGGSDAPEVLAVDRATKSIDAVSVGDPVVPPTPLITLTAEPQRLLLADLDNDGIADAVVAAKTNRGVALQILKGNKDGGFDPPVPAPSTCGNGVVEGSELCDDGNVNARDGCSATCQPEIGTGLASLVAADLDGDGNLDLVAANLQGQIIALMGNGQRGFSKVRKLVKVKSRTQIAVADFNDDLAPDIIGVPAGGAGRGLLLLTNDGTGQFAPTLIPLSFRVTGPLLAGDFDGDGLVDLAAGVRGGVTVLYNDGDGPTSDIGKLPVPYAPSALAVADVNEDGQSDLLVAGSRSAQPVMFFPATTDGQFGPGQAVGVKSGAVAPTVVDIDQDGHLDVVLCNGTNCLGGYGDGSGRFRNSPPPPPTNFIGRSLLALAVADVDGDGVNDLVGISRRDEKIVVLFGAGTLPAARVELATGSKPRAFTIADIDGDGRLDIVSANSGSDDVTIFLNGGNRQFTALPAATWLPRAFDMSGIAAADLDGDGKPELIVSDQATSRIQILKILNLNNLTGGGLATIATIPIDGPPATLAMGDLNGDSVPDFVTANTDNNTVSVLLSAGGGTAYDVTTFSSGGLQPIPVALADLDGDHDLDLIIANQQSNNVVTFLNDGTGAFTPQKVAQVRGRQGPVAMCTGDIDGDGITDVAIANVNSQDVFLLFGKGDGSWRPDERVYQIGGDLRALVCTDTKGTGRTDIIFGRRSAGTVDVILNQE